MRVKDQILTIAKYESPVIIQGESGTGKEIVARYIHAHSHRAQNALVSVNCASISETLFESEFFGHKKGSFTGAYENKTGFFAQANGGTLFLDEIGELPLAMQPKLLRVLESGEFSPLGEVKTQKTNASIICASNRDLRQMMDSRTFREDLFHRLDYYSIYLPPLRERGTDIILLANHFVQSFNKLEDKKKYLDPQTERQILKHPWPGNIRELRNAIFKACINSREDDKVMPDDLIISEATNPRQPIIQIPEEGIDLERDVLSAYYEAAIRKANGNKARAARYLKLDPHTFRARLRVLDQ